MLHMRIVLEIRTNGPMPISTIQGIDLLEAPSEVAPQ